MFRRAAQITDGVTDWGKEGVETFWPVLKRPLCYISFDLRHFKVQQVCNVINDCLEHDGNIMSIELTVQN